MKFLHEFIPTGNNKFIDNGYWEIIDNEYDVGDIVRVENYSGGFHPHRIQPNDEIITSDWTTIMRKHYLNKQDSQYGWIDLEGNFYGCEYQEHKMCAEACFGLSERDAEKAGFVKIFDNTAWYDEYDETIYYHEKFLTDAQRKTIIDRGLTLNDEDVE